MQAPDWLAKLVALNMPIISLANSLEPSGNFSYSFKQCYSYEVQYHTKF